MNLITYWIARRRLRREIAALVRAGEEQASELEGRPSRLAGPVILYGTIEYERLLERAHRLGIDYHYNSRLDAGYEVNEHGRLIGTGYPMLRKAISDERFNRAERWVKVLVPLITAVAGLLGVLVALVSLGRR